MAHKLAKLRLRAAEAQGFRCYYCALPIWETDPQAFCTHLRLGPRQATLLHSTAEHLVARRDGGRDSGDNIVAACHFCNQMRHAVPTPKTAAAYRVHVRARMRKGRWLAGVLALPQQVAGTSIAGSPRGGAA